MASIETIAVIGAGTMGHGIAQVAAASGFRVLLSDVDREALARGVQSIEKNLAKGIQLAKLTEDERDRTLQQIHGTITLEECAIADLIVEAAPEKLDLKRDILRQLESLSDREFIFASNTSSLSITEIARESKRPEAVIGMHFFNPVHIMRLVEIVVGERTAPRRLKQSPPSAADAQRADRRERRAGFCVEPVGSGAGSRSDADVGAGSRECADIDMAMELGYNHPMGPLKLTDLVGLDVRLSIAEYLHRELGTETFRPPEVLRRMVSEGKLGKKTGQGFYDWSKDKEDLRRAQSS